MSEYGNYSHRKKDSNSSYTEYPNGNPWKRGRPEIFATRDGYYEIRKNHDTEAFDDHIYVNMDIDMDTKRAALVVSESVVSLVCRTGEKATFMASGTIIDSMKDPNSTYSSTVLTSASIVTSSTDDTKKFLSELKIQKEYGPLPFQVEVYLSDDTKLYGCVSAYDLHYNLAIINIRSDAPLPIATLRLLNDGISIDPREIRRPRDVLQIRPHSELFNLCPGEMVVAVGRHFIGSYLMVAPGRFSLDRCQYDCKELMKANSKISKCGIGGPLVNSYGEVIGVNFYDELCTPFLPINIVSKCLEHFKKHGKFSRPWLGMEATNLYAASVDKLEKIIQNFPNISKGVLVEKVIPGSPAEVAGIRRNDVIVQCGGNIVRGFLEFFENLIDKVGGPVEVTVIRKYNAFLKLRLVAGETCPDKINSWPLPQQRLVRAKRARVQND